MRRTGAALLAPALLALATGASAGAGQDVVRVEGVQLVGEGRVRLAHLADLDGDGRQDLFLSVERPDSLAGELQVHRAGAGNGRS